MKYTLVKNGEGDSFIVPNVVKNEVGTEFVVADDVKDGEGNPFTIFTTEAAVVIPREICVVESDRVCVV